MLVMSATSFDTKTTHARRRSVTNAPPGKMFGAAARRRLAKAAGYTTFFGSFGLCYQHALGPHAGDRPNSIEAMIKPAWHTRLNRSAHTRAIA